MFDARFNACTFDRLHEAQFLFSQFLKVRRRKWRWWRARSPTKIVNQILNLQHIVGIVEIWRGAEHQRRRTTSSSVRSGSRLAIRFDADVVLIWSSFVSSRST